MSSAAAHSSGHDGDGQICHSVRADRINRYGPIHAWVTLDTVTLTNTTRLYFDASAPGQPKRLYRLVPLL
jgi:hypothetical protein